MKRSVYYLVYSRYSGRRERHMNRPMSYTWNVNTPLIRNSVEAFPKAGSCTYIPIASALYRMSELFHQIRPLTGE